MTFLILEPFFKCLKDTGIQVHIHDYERIILALNSGGYWDINRLKNVLASLLTKNPEQYDIFLARFKEYFCINKNYDYIISESEKQNFINILHDIINKNKHTIYKEDNESKVEKYNKIEKLYHEEKFIEDEKITFLSICFNFLSWLKKYKFFALIFLTIFIFAGYFIYDLYDPEPVEKEPAELVEKKLAEQVEKKPSVVNKSIYGHTRLYPQMPYVKKDDSKKILYKSKWKLYLILAVTFLLCSIIFISYIIKKRKITTDKPIDWDKNGERAFLLNTICQDKPCFIKNEELDEIADSIGYFTGKSQSKIINIIDSVKKTLKNGGMPDIVFKQRKEIRSVLILEHRYSEAKMFNTIARDLYKGLSQRNISVIYGLYEESPESFSELDKKYYLEDFEEFRNGIICLLFVDLDSFNIKQHEKRFDIEKCFYNLSKWPMKACISYYNNEFENAHELITILNNNNIPIYPANADGIFNAITNYINEKGSFKQSLKKRLDSLNFSGNIEAEIEIILQDALPWAQDCSMIQPITLGMADTLRKTFYPHLSVYDIERIINLPDTSYGPSGISFSQDVLIALKKGFFNTRNKKNKKNCQEAVLNCILKYINLARPDIKSNEKPSLSYLKWMAAKDQIIMEFDPDYNMENISKLLQTPLGLMITEKLESYTLNNEKGKIPLNLNKNNQKALQRLARIKGNPLNIPVLKVFPVKKWQWSLLIFLAVLTVIFSISGLNNYINTPIIPDIKILSNKQVIAELEIKENNSYKHYKLWKSDKYNIEIPQDCELRLNLFKYGLKNSFEFKFFKNNQTILTIDHKDVKISCAENNIESGLEIIRCPEINEDKKDAALVKSWKESLIEFDKNALNDRELSIGIIIIQKQINNNILKKDLNELELNLLNSRSIDILYKISINKDDFESFNKIINQINNDLKPWISDSQLILIKTIDLDFSFDFQKKLAFNRIFIPGNTSNFDWIKTMNKILNQNESKIISEGFLINKLKNASVSDKGFPVTLISMQKNEYKPIENELGMKFVYIPPGIFTMGSPKEEDGRFDNEVQHKVKLTKGFYMQTTEVTQEQWIKVMGNNPSKYKKCGKDCPVESVSWEDVQEFIAKIQKIDDRKYSLPTEAQWEYAARAGTSSPIYSGNLEILDDRNAPDLDKIAWYGGNSCVDYKGGWDCSSWNKQYKCSNCGPHPVGKKDRNNFGLYDMIGNVYEWCQDWYGDYDIKADSKKHSYDIDMSVDPIGSDSGSNRVDRGGSWFSDARFCRSALRDGDWPSFRIDNVGFRLVLPPGQ